MFEIDVTIPTPNIALSGTLCLPEKQGVFPVLLMVHGSGNIDRNENLKKQKLNIFNTFAHYLAEKGIASFRYDKRGVGKSTGDYYSAGHFDLVDDAMACLKYLLNNEHCDKDALFLLGHSEGSIIVPQMSQRYPPVAGIIMLTPFIDTMESILMKQAAGLQVMADDLTGIKSMLISLYFFLFNPVKSQAKLISKINDTSTNVVYSMFQKIPAKWLRELFMLDPIDIYKKTSCPSLAIGGSKDIQCDPDDVEKIRNVIGGPIDAHVIEDMSHILRIESGKPSFFNYTKLMAKPIMPELLDLVYEWTNNVICHNQAAKKEN